ncbi:disease resistance protein Pik-2-like [Phragmites australis]|uniref:disease resistance protein Pik-2-like n=1 Tax=Phragmites australis TaxID=29695 RepID=UPI002D793845|nr:disease resistance protein Pik-2-like [Phragmites australis]
MMQSLLKVASAHPEAAGRTDTVRTWVKQVRDLAYDVEDCLLDFALYAARTSSSRTGSWRPGALAERHRIADRIRDLKASVEELNQRNLRYHIIVDLPAARAEEQAAVLPDHDVHSAELAFQESDIIGRRNEKAKLTKLISGAEPEIIHERDHVATRSSLGGLISIFLSNFMEKNFVLARSPPSARPPSPRSNGALRVVSVWGMGGMGKSSLVRMVHNDPELLDEFDCGAWVTVPHPLDNPDVFRRRLSKELGVANGQDLGVHLREKRYRVIVDDLLNREEWEHIRRVFQFENNKGSCIIVTTRREDVALHCARAGHVPEGHELIYELKPLGDAESMDLLCSKVYKTTKYTLPADMAEQASHILRRCHVLPLAISTIGGLLANRPKTGTEWRNLHEYLRAELESDLNNIPKVIVSSYDGLPYHLKSIFLYLSIFPENHEIKCTRLLRRWMAEGYITKKCDMPVEDVGERFYRELINKSMIQPAKVSPGVRADRCRVHSMVLQIILSKSIEDNQLFLIEKKSNEAPQSKIRHLVVSRWKRRDEKLQNINLSYIRSLTIFGEYPSSLISPEMQLLRVLDLEDTVNLKNDDLKHIGELQHLRYLCL